MMLIRIVFSQKSMFSRCCCRRSYSLTHHNVDTFARLLLSSCVTPFYCSRNCGTFLNAQGQHILIYAFIINRSTRFSRLLSIHAMTQLPMGGLWYRQARENIWAFFVWCNRFAYDYSRSMVSISSTRSYVVCSLRIVFQKPCSLTTPYEPQAKQGCCLLWPMLQSWLRRLFALTYDMGRSITMYSVILWYIPYSRIIPTVVVS